ncbi:MAG TPA: Smr/MutS family protein [Steroidobacteraceae bacterium]|nr:Smr/MutS family protein [Steroidobacteraceae bacterium]
MTKQRSSGRAAADDLDADTRAFRAAVSDVLPLAQTPPAAGLERPKPRARKLKAAASVTENLDAVMPLIGTVPANAAENGVTGEAIVSFHRGGVRDQVMRRLRRGLYPIDGELDLHGLTQMAARDRLADFLARSRGHSRCVRIIHGKGYRSGARGPVLKTAVNLWLRRHMDVMAFVSARAIDGGAGAVYVLLRS